MKYATIIRHAKSAHPAATGDHERPLDARGQRDAPRMGALLQARFPVPDVLLASTALRVQQTVAALAEGGMSGLPDAVETHEQLYLAEPEVIWDFLASALMEHDDVWLVAHNPGVTDAVELLSGARLEAMPTLAVARIAFEEVAYDTPGGTLVHYDTPAAHRVLLH